MQSVTSYCLQTDKNRISTLVTKASVVFNTIIIVHLFIFLSSYYLLESSSALAIDFVPNPYSVFTNISTPISASF